MNSSDPLDPLRDSNRRYAIPVNRPWTLYYIHSGQGGFLGRRKGRTHHPLFLRHRSSLDLAPGLVIMPSSVDEEPSNTSTPPRSRQKPGSACEECRRRKLKCDRKRPDCGLCLESGVKCRVGASGPRGPKRGQRRCLPGYVNMPRLLFLPSS